MADPSTNKSSDALSEDTLLKAALQDVPLPPGLAQRLKARIRAEYQNPTSSSLASAQAMTRDESLRAAVSSALSESSVGTAGEAVPASLSRDIALGGVKESSDQANSDEPTIDEQVGGGHSGGWLRRSILLAALAAGICGFAVLARQWTRPAESSWLAAQCDSILVKIEEDNPANWHSVSQPVPPGLLRAQSQLVRVAIVAERSLPELGFKNQGTVYRLDAGDGRGIYLMRLEALPAVRGVTSRFEILPTPSGGWSLAAMTVGNETFVLAAACTEKQIFNYIRRPDLT